MLEDAGNLPQQPPPTELPPKSFGQKTWDYLKSRFNADNWFGSLIIPLTQYVNYEGWMSARTHQVHGIPAPDRARAISAQAQIAERTWSFFSARGGKFPEGDTVLQRMENALKHPQLSSTQFGWLTILPIALLNNTNHMIAGLKAYGIGLKPGETAYKAERIRFYTGLYQTPHLFLQVLGILRSTSKGI